jgi:hypothetical protein
MDDRERAIEVIRTLTRHVLVPCARSAVAQLSQLSPFARAYRQAYRTALHQDCCCYEAFKHLTEHHLLTSDDEQTLLSEVCGVQQQRQQ